MLPRNHAIPITAADATQVGQARRQAALLGQAIGMDELRLGELGIVVTEAARNLAVHAKAGEIVLSPWEFERSTGIDIFALDRAAGIADINDAMRDGYSTAGTAGEGLGAMQRLASTLQIFSQPGHGTALFARLLRDTNEGAQPDPYKAACICVPYPGEHVCGDAWSAVHTADRSVYIVADGLGHGPLAADASQEAIRVFHEVADRQPEGILAAIHLALSKTRGAAVAVAEILPKARVLNFAGAGNIAGVIYSEGKTRSMVSMNGTVGHTVARFQQFAYEWAQKSTLIMHSDGIATRWNLDQYPGIAMRHPGMTAALLYRDFARGRDDATVLVSRL
ncbi:SpoIIE family protein phosphatase [Silvibacterium acidisoli]|uniref:SpoIIE family protein phosphatase n=1 Tax=Acidobacteriaceae bacterium ZG23-2 TaxID=2883246 RepID=UPI00406D02C1